MLITRMRFPRGTPHGVSLSRMAKVRRPKVKVLFVADLEMEEFAEGVGQFLPKPATAAEVVAVEERMLAAAAHSASSRHMLRVVRWLRRAIATKKSPAGKTNGASLRVPLSMPAIGRRSSFTAAPAITQSRWQAPAPG